MEQKFVLLASPWWGGFYQCLIRSVNFFLYKFSGKGLLRYGELETVLCQIEFVLNNHPLIYVSEEYQQNTQFRFILSTEDINSQDILNIWNV